MRDILNQSKSQEGENHINMPRQPALNPEILQAAIEGLELQRTRLDELIAQVRARLGKRGPGRPPKAAKKASTKPTKKKRTISAAGRKRIAAAAKKRWAEWKKQQAAEG